MAEQEWLNNNQLSLDIWNKKYRYNNETFEEWLDRVSGGDSEVKRLIREKKFLFGGRILSNRGTDKGAMSNCNSLGYIEDSLIDIMQANTNLALTYKAQGGQGLDLSKLRPKGTLIHGNFPSDGIVPFMEMFDITTKSISQGGSRRGALLMALDIWHKEAETFMSIKSDLKKINNANLSLDVDDKFMSIIDNYYKTGEEPIIHIKREYEGNIIEYDVEPVKLYKKLCDYARKYAEPGILFVDRMKQYNMAQNHSKYRIECTNACVSGDTLILTEEGYRKIQDLIDTEVSIWNGFKWSRVIPKVTGHNIPMYRVWLSNGNYLDCTSYHKWIISTNYNGGTRRVETQNLKIGDKLAKYEFPIINKGDTIDTKIAYMQGFFSGDGCFTQDNKCKIFLYDKKKELISYFPDCIANNQESDNRIQLSVTKYRNLLNKDFVPDTTYSIKSRLDWLAGLIDSDGTFAESLQISSVNIKFLIKVLYLINTLGCTGKVSLMKKGGKYLLPNHKDGYSTYNVRDCYRLIIPKYQAIKLVNLGLNTHRVKIDTNCNREASQYLKITKIEQLEIAETVYCFNEPLNHTGVFNGIMTGQCSEIPMTKHGACILGSINVGAYILNPFTKKSTINWDSLSYDIKNIVKAMDDIVSENQNKHILKDQAIIAETYRNVGIGIMGLADLFVKLGIRYGSSDSLHLAKDLMKFIFRQCILSSIDLATTRGNFPGYESSVWDSDIIKQNFTLEEINNFKQKNKLRNLSIVSIAPTGSIGTMLNISTGAEPYFALEFKRRTVSLDGDNEHIYKVYVDTINEYQAITNKRDIPYYFITSKDIPWKERVDIQAALQTSVDQAISSTVNLPTSTTNEDIEQLYLYAWKKGCKGITVYVEGSRDAILSTDNKEENKQESKTRELKRGEVVKADNSCIGLKRDLLTGCGSLHCQAFFDSKSKELRECYLSKGSLGGCQNYMIGLSRMISLSARGGLSINAIVDQLKSCGVCPSYAVRTATKKDTSKGSCCPVAVGNALLDMYKEMQETLKSSKEKQVNTEIIKEMPKEELEECPNCHEKSLTRQGGCFQCLSCGFSRCD